MTVLPSTQSYVHIVSKVTKAPGEDRCQGPQHDTNCSDQALWLGLKKN